MTSVPHIPASAPFTAEQRAWLNGYLAGLFADASAGKNALDSRSQLPSAAEPLLVLYGSQTGTAEQLAKRLAAEAEKHGFKPRVLEMNAFAAVDFAKEQRLILVTSTWGDGDPPDNAAAFWSHLHSEQVPKLNHLGFSVLALGDRNYANFCGAGKKFDERLEQLGAKRIHPRTDCDVDYEAPAEAWMEGLWPALQHKPGDGREAIGDRSNTATSNGECPLPIAHHLSPVFSRNHPFTARRITHRKLNAPGSAKDTRHFEISLPGSELTYEVGDALGVMPANCPALVSDLLGALGCDGEEAVLDPQGKETSLRCALLRHFQITQPPFEFVEAVAERSGDADLKALLEPARKADLNQYLTGREVIDLLLNFPAAKFSFVEFVGLLRKLQPRLYSIASSPKAHPDEVHLTVAVVRYASHGRERKGVCSTFLAERVHADTPVPVFVQTSSHFRLPKDSARPMIMIGPGTGVAPFRAFLEERQAVGANGKHWLFFGDQRRATDFLYQTELEAKLADGILTRLDTAFSRDQAEKIYVQHRLLENAAELWAWIEDGAHVYVCGDAKRMAKDVDAAFHEVITKAGGKSREQAEEYVARMKTEKRYQRDVY
ncbi:MAG: assimilatory sulfite reductase (NADPH) flavoprotein subunit [Verrucomicrobia bacterium]|nr:assimilatory sulfite reductase (NADPH) flavoprotein subunit [Verrucomicrobiota bacterium]